MRLDDRLVRKFRMKALVGFVYFFVFIFSVYPAFGQAKEDIKGLYSQGISYYQHDQLDEATQSFAKILQMDPSHKGAASYLEKKIPDRIAKIESIKRAAQLREEKKAQNAQRKRASAIDKALNKAQVERPQQRRNHEKILSRRLDKAVEAK